MIAARPEREELLVRAQALVPVLASRSAESERARRCPDETIEDFRASGLLRICQPARYGGYELGWDVLCEVSQTLARGCGSQAWVQNILTDHAQKIAGFAPAAQDEVWGEDRDARVAASFDPVGRGRRVAGGVVYSGRHGFSSGIDHAAWLLCGGRLVEPGGALGERCFFLVPKRDVTVIDDWDVFGLCGTGSKSFEAVEVFIPEHRVLRGSDSDDGTGPGSALNTAPIFRMPRGGITSTGFAAVGVGIAEGLLADWTATTRTRSSRGVAVGALATTHALAGTASAEISAAAGLYVESARDAMRTLESGGTISSEQKLRARRNSAFAAQLVLAAAGRLVNHAGGRALYRSGTLQRRYRDLLAVASHHSLMWDECSSGYGAYLLQNEEGPPNGGAP